MPSLVGDEQAATTDPAGGGRCRIATLAPDASRCTGASSLEVLPRPVCAVVDCRLDLVGFSLLLLVACSLAISARQTEPFGVVTASVFNIAIGQRAGLQAVDAGIHRRLGAGDRAALEVGVTTDTDIEAAIAGLDTALFGHAGKVATDLVTAIAGAGTEPCAKGHTRANTLVLAVVRAGVLQALDAQIATDIGDHLVRRQLRALERGVIATNDRGRVARSQMTIAVGHVFAIGFAARSSCTDHHAKCGTIRAVSDTDTQRRAAALTGTFCSAVFFAVSMSTS